MIKKNSIYFRQQNTPLAVLSPVRMNLWLSAQAAIAIKEKTRNLVLLNVDEGARWCSNGIRAEKENGENLLCIFENIVILTYVTFGVYEGGVVCI